MKILIVEDEIYARQSLKKQIESIICDNITIMEASNGQQAWQIFQKHSPEIIFLDIQIPGISGIDLLRLFSESEYSNFHVIMVSGYANFEFAKDALRYGAEAYILKPVEDKELSQCLEKIFNISKMRKEQQTLEGNDSFTQHIYHNMISTDTKKDFINETLFSKIFSSYFIAGIYFDHKEKPDKNLFLQHFRKLNVQSYDCEFRIVEISRQQWNIVIKNSVHYKKILNNINLALENCGYNIYIGLSNSYQDLNNISSACEEMLIALKSKIFYNSKIIHYDFVYKQRKNGISISAKPLNALPLYLIHGDKNKAMENINDLVQMCFKDNYSVSILTNFLSEISLILYNQILLNSNNNISEPLSSFEINILKYNDVNELIKAIKRRINLFFDYSNNKTVSTNVAETIIEYIKTNCNKELSLKYLAEQVFYLNPSYLSHLISEKTGKNYSSYIKHIRLKKAIEYLENTHYSVTAVASLVGYNDTSQFIQTFKKEMGITPKKYQDRNKFNQMTKC